MRLSAPTFAAFVAALLLLSALTTPVQAQEGWSASLCVAASRHLTHEGGPALGAPGVELQLFAPSDGRWVFGGMLAYHEVGRFPHSVPGDYRDESAFVPGRGCAASACSGRTPSDRSERSCAWPRRTRRLATASAVTGASGGTSGSA